MPPASSDLAMDAAESVLWFRARSSWALVVAVGPLVVVAAAVALGDGAAIWSFFSKRERDRKSSEHERKKKNSARTNDENFHSFRFFL